MTLIDYIKHYLNLKNMGCFLIASFFIVVVIHFILLFVTKKKEMQGNGKMGSKVFLQKFGVMKEEYYELMFSSTCILFFTGLYFLIDHNYFEVSEKVWQFWVQYEGYILLGFIVISILFNNAIDHHFVPLERINKEDRGYLRMLGMLYMLVIFVYIKFIDQNNNYDTILGYFITMVIGRFVYFDASGSDFICAVKKVGEMLPILGLVLVSTALLSLYGFKAEYLLRSNGVVVSLFIAHFFSIIEIGILYRTKFFERISEKILLK